LTDLELLDCLQIGGRKMLVCVKVETRDTRQSVGSVQEQSQTRTRPRTNVATAVGDKEIERNAQRMCVAGRRRVVELLDS
jgi:hypothetical protein